MRPTMRSEGRFAILVTAFLACGAAGSRAADTPGGVANWFELVAEAERLAEADAHRQEKPAPAPAPAPVPSPGEDQPPPRPHAVIAPPPPANLDALRALIEKRNRFVNERLFETVKKLAAGGRAEPRQIQALTDWFAIYFQMRAFQPTSRRDPNLGSVTEVLQDAIGRRQDFVEGRILLATCHMYAGKPQDARSQLEEASRFLTARGLNPSPFGLDCCGGWLRLGEPDAVKGFVTVLKNERIVPENRLTVVQAMLVAVHAWQTFRFNDAKSYFEKALRKAKAFDKAPMAPGVEGVVADAALFYLVAGNPETRDTRRGAMLLDKIPADNRTWTTRRARAALEASKAVDADDAAELWDAAVRELEACRQDSLPTLDAEIDEQLARYRTREPWFRERPKAPAKAEGGASNRQSAGHVADGDER